MTSLLNDSKTVTTATAAAMAAAAAPAVLVKDTYTTYEALLAHVKTLDAKHKLLALNNSMPFVNGNLCRLVAVANALNCYNEAKIINCVLPSIRKRPDNDTSSPNPKPISLRKIAKDTTGSKVGEFYTEPMVKKFIAGLGQELKNPQIENATVEFKRFNISTDTKLDEKDAYAAFIKNEIDHGRPPIVYYEMKTAPNEHGHPLLTGTGEYEHSAVVIGYLMRDKLSFVLAHGGKFTIVYADELAISASHLMECRTKPQVFHKIKTSGDATHPKHATRWAAHLTFFSTRYTDVYKKIVKASETIKDGEAVKIPRPDGSFITLFRRQGYVNVNHEPGFKSAVCTIKPAAK